MTYRITYLFFAATFFLFITSCGSNNQSAEEQDEASETSTVVTQENEDDPLSADATTPQDRVLLAAMSIRMQQQLSRMAQQKAESETVKQLGETILDTNEEALTMLNDLAEATETEVIGSLSPAQQQVVDSLDQLSGSDFEKALVQTLVEDQRQNIDNLEAMNTEADNPIVRDISAELLEIQQPQLESVQSVQEEMM